MQQELDDQNKRFEVFKVRRTWGPMRPVPPVYLVHTHIASTPLLWCHAAGADGAVETTDWVGGLTWR